MPFLKGEHGLPVNPEVGGIELVVEHVVDGDVLKVLVGGHEQLQQLHAGAGGKGVFPVGVGVLALLLGDAAEGEVGVFLVQGVILGENGLAGIDDGGDGTEQVPHALEMVVHFAAAAHNEALGGVIDAVAGTAGQRQMLKQGDVIAGHLGVADQENGSSQAAEAGADYVG